RPCWQLQGYLRTNLWVFQSLRNHTHWICKGVDHFQITASDCFERHDLGRRQVMPDDLQVLCFFEITVKYEKCSDVLVLVKHCNNVQIQYVPESRGGH